MKLVPNIALGLALGLAALANACSSDSAQPARTGATSAAATNQLDPDVESGAVVFVKNPEAPEAAPYFADVGRVITEEEPNVDAVSDSEQQGSGFALAEEAADEGRSDDRRTRKLIRRALIVKHLTDACERLANDAEFAEKVAAHPKFSEKLSQRCAKLEEISAKMLADPVFGQCKIIVRQALEEAMAANGQSLDAEMKAQLKEKAKMLALECKAEASESSEEALALAGAGGSCSSGYGCAGYLFGAYNACAGYASKYYGVNGGCMQRK